MYTYTNIICTYYIYNVYAYSYIYLNSVPHIIYIHIYIHIFHCWLDLHWWCCWWHATRLPGPCTAAECCDRLCSAEVSCREETWRHIVKQHETMTMIIMQICKLSVISSHNHDYDLIIVDYPAVVEHGLLEDPQFSSMNFPTGNLRFVRWFPIAMFNSRRVHSMWLLRIKHN